MRNVQIDITVSKKQLFGDRGPRTNGELNLWNEIVAARWMLGFKLVFWIAIGAAISKYLFT